MGSPLSPVVAIIFVESFESVALENSELQPKVWFRYVDDTFIIWPHGRDTLDNFLGHPNTQHPAKIHPAQKLSVVNSLVSRAVSVSEPDSLSKELQHVKSSL
ncbi:hypothetical protein Trydic_g18485 [Trypoxylus dichotomus]